MGWIQRGARTEEMAAALGMTAEAMPTHCATTAVPTPVPDASSGVSRKRMIGRAAAATPASAWARCCSN